MGWGAASEAVAGRVLIVSVLSAGLSVAGCLLLAMDAERWYEITRSRSCGMCGYDILFPILVTVTIVMAGLACALTGCVAGLRLALRRRQPLWIFILLIGVFLPLFIIAARFYGILSPFSLEERPLYATYTLLLLPSLVVTSYAYAAWLKLRARGV